MTLTSLFCRLKWDSASRRTRRASATRTRPGRQRRQPWLETLEDRALPSTLTVTSTADDGSAGTLRAVLAAAHSGDMIRFAQQIDGQTITLTQGQLSVSQNLTIAGPGASELSISGGGTSRIFDIAAGATATISGLTLTGGVSTDGGAVLNGGTLNLSQDVLSGDVAQGIAGGGLFADGGGRGGAVENQAGATLNVVSSTLSGDEAIGAMNASAPAKGYGGAIDNEGGTLTVTQSVLSNDQAVAGSGGFAEGGAINSSLGTVTISGSTIRNNTATAGPESGGVAAGGGIGSGFDVFTLTDSTLSNNEAVCNGGFLDAFGGGAFLQDQASTISGTTFANNQVSVPDGLAWGGGLYLGVYPSGPAGSMTDCVFTGNIATGLIALGGGMRDIAAESIGNTTFSGNVAQNVNGTSDGGGLEILANPPFGGSVSLTKCTFAQNVARVVPGAVGRNCVGGGLADSGFTLTATNCTFAGNSATAAQAAPGFAAPGFGGGIAVSSSSLTLTNCTISGNQAAGGPGGNGQAGGLAFGGGLMADFGSSVTLNNSLIAGNVARGGVGGSGSPGGAAEGGGIENNESTLSLTDSILTGNVAQGGQGGSGGAGGLGAGGSVFSQGLSGYPATTTLTDCLITANLADGGTGGSGASGGNGEGGGLFIGANSVDILRSSDVVGNAANGGAGGSGGTAGQGIGGGAYNLGTLNVDALSMIFANFASTSNDNVFGPITPI